eukprot:scaffold16767_cov122-Isochrysis_galbana.AAC.4
MNTVVAFLLLFHMRCTRSRRGGDRPTAHGGGLPRGTIARAAPQAMIARSGGGRCEGGRGRG